MSSEDGRAVRSSSGPEGEAMRLAVLESISGPGIISITNYRKPRFWSFTERGVHGLNGDPKKHLDK